MANGQPDAGSYPLCVLWEEARAVSEYHNRIIASQAVLTQMAVMSLFDKDAGKQFSKTVLELSGDGG